MIPSSSETDHTIPILAGTAVALGTGAATWLLRQRKRQVPEVNPFSDEHITSTFVAALPTIKVTEVATAVERAGVSRRISFEI